MNVVQGTNSAVFASLALLERIRFRVSIGKVQDTICISVSPNLSINGQNKLHIFLNANVGAQGFSYNYGDMI